MRRGKRECSHSTSCCPRNWERERTRGVGRWQWREVYKYACLYLQAFLYLQTCMFVCVCMCVHSHPYTCSCDTYILQMDGTCIMGYYTPNTNAKLCIKHIQKWWRILLNNGIDTRCKYHYYECPKSYALSANLETHKSIKLVQFPKVSGMPPSNTLSFRYLKRKSPQNVFSVSTWCHDALKKQIVSSSTPCIFTYKRCIWSVWYTDLWSLAFITIVYYNSHI